MKKFNIYILVLVLVTLFACEDEYKQPFPVSDVTWYTSMPTLTEYTVSEGEMMGFIDASQNPLSHQWIIENGSYFLKKGFKQGDSLEYWIDENRGLVTTDPAINVLFMESGRKSVRLKNTFSDSVAYNGVRPRYAYKENGIWVIDTTFTVDVYGPTKPAYRICRVIENPDGTLVPGTVELEIAADEEIDSISDNWKAIDVEVGERLMFIDLTDEIDIDLVKPNSRIWTIRNHSEPMTSNDSVAIAYFNVYGYKTTGLGNVLTERNVTGIPAGRAQKAIPLRLEVVSSSQPFTYADGAVWTSETSIAFNVSGEVKSLGDAPESGFNVQVKNARTGYNQTIGVNEVTVDPINLTRINLSLAASIYGDDEITVSFDATGTSIESVDERSFQSFDAKLVGIPSGGEDVLASKKDWAGFEGTGAGLNAAYCPGYWVGAQDANAPEWSRTIVIANEGDASMMYNGDINAKWRLFGMNFGDNVDIEAGAFEVSHKIYIEEGSDIKVLRTDIARKSTSWAVDVNILWDIESVKRGEWVTIKKIVNFPVDYNSLDKTRYSYYVEAVNNTGVSGQQTFYLDDFELRKVDAGTRP